MTVNSIIPETSRVSFEHIRDFLVREASFFDDGEFDRWLDCYHPDAEFWIPAGSEGSELCGAPQREVSLIHYSNRRGIEQRISHIRAAHLSSASSEIRTCHNVTNMEILEERGEVVDVRFEWLIRRNAVVASFGSSFYTIDCTGTQPVIMKKKDVPKSD